ncbi:MAG: thiamine-monophosphate kinase [Alphaproteobacteria bacterium]|nr:thiamine-monophosphate kinase [Alphaproteobacteria bacterium]
MPRFDPTATVADVGEKFLIEQMLRPMFNPDNNRNLAGDDCAAIEVPPGSFVIASTDRVPADLISFRAGVLDFEHFGRYLGVLNLSDIAACGGVPLVILFNCGLPSELRVDALAAISRGLRDVASRFGCKIAGGDVTSASELSLSATIIGHVDKRRMLRRSGARAGDSIFVSRSLGLTPVALDYCLNRKNYAALTGNDTRRLEAQFTALDPEIDLGQKLSAHGMCTSCMDNTDGVGQCLLELAREAGYGFVVMPDRVQLDPIVAAVASRNGVDALDFALGPGADFALVGTLSGEWSDEKACHTFGGALRILGTVVEGDGVYLARNGAMQRFVPRGWNYFVPPPPHLTASLGSSFSVSSVSAG